MINPAANVSFRATEIPGHWIAEVRLPSGKLVFASGLRSSLGDAMAAADSFCAGADHNGRFRKGAVLR